MNLQKIPFRNTQAFSEVFLKYMEAHPSLRPFYSRFPEISNFKEQIVEKASFPEATRKVLVETLQRQYNKIPSLAAPVKDNIQALLKKNTFTVTTGHQLNIFTGPLYFIYKIITVINTCKQLSSRYPESRFVPVYWMASEDHDYEEIKSFRLNGKKYTWETQQQGGVGRFDTKEIEKVLQQLPGDVSIFREAYQKNKSLADAVRHYVNRLFCDEGLVVIDADDRALKTLLQPVIRADVFENIPNRLVTQTNLKLAAGGNHAPVNPREINFFYLDQNLRSRIEKQADQYVVVDTDLKFSRSEIENQINGTPEKFSPNVILRPLYQEIILPNLAYVGGPAELVYWLELKGVFDHFKVPFPILLPRNFALVIDAPTGRKLAKTGLDIQDFFEEKNFLFNQWVTKHSSHDLSLGTVNKTMNQAFADILDRGRKIDATLEPMIAAEAKRLQNAVEKIEKKMLRAEKRKHDDRLRQIEAVKDALFPSGSLQERTDNFLNFHQQDHDFIAKLLNHFDPFDFRFNVLNYHD